MATHILENTPIGDALHRCVVFLRARNCCPVFQHVCCRKKNDSNDNDIIVETIIDDDVNAVNDDGFVVI